MHVTTGLLLEDYLAAMGFVSCRCCTPFSWLNLQRSLLSCVAALFERRTNGGGAGDQPHFQRSSSFVTAHTHLCVVGGGSGLAPFSREHLEIGGGDASSSLFSILLLCVVGGLDSIEILSSLLSSPLLSFSLSIFAALVLSLLFLFFFNGRSIGECVGRLTKSFAHSHSSSASSSIDAWS